MFHRKQISLLSYPQLEKKYKKKLLVHGTVYQKLKQYLIKIKTSET